MQEECLGMRQLWVRIIQQYRSAQFSRVEGFQGMTGGHADTLPADGAHLRQTAGKPRQNDCQEHKASCAPLQHTTVGVCVLLPTCLLLPLFTKTPAMLQAAAMSVVVYSTMVAATSCSSTTRAVSKMQQHGKDVIQQPLPGRARVG